MPRDVPLCVCSWVCNCVVCVRAHACLCTWMHGKGRVALPGLTAHMQVGGSVPRWGPGPRCVLPGCVTLSSVFCELVSWQFYFIT